MLARDRVTLHTETNLSRQNLAKSVNERDHGSRCLR
jgi:hypothetical protein